MTRPPPTTTRGSLAAVLTLLLLFSASQTQGRSLGAGLEPVDDLFLYQGDMLLSQGQLNDRLQRKMTITNYFWPRTKGELIINYLFGDDKVEKDKVRRAMNDWEAKTCVTFKEIPASVGGAYLKFIDEGTCQSVVGKQSYDGPHLVRVAKGCSDRMTIHELGHALGFEHEHCRSDRDEYIKVLPENASVNQTYNFAKVATQQYYVPYDFYSVMHYGSWAFSENKAVTIRTLNPIYQQLAGQGQTLSYMDALMFNTAYRCIEKWEEQCPETYCWLGYTKRDRKTGRCFCQCPDGTSGEICEDEHKSYNKAVLAKGSPHTRKFKRPGKMTSIGYPKVHSGWTSYTQLVKAPHCKKAVVTFRLFDVDGRSDNKCILTAVEIRLNDSPTAGKLFCGTEIAPGTSFVSDTDTVILHFFSYYAGHKGYSADITFRPIPNCA